MVLRGVPVLVGCALIALAIASSDETVLLQSLDDPAPHVALQTPDERLVNAKKGSAEGPDDPGYGKASASRTDHQRVHERKQVARQKHKKHVQPLDPFPGGDTRRTTKAIKKRIDKLSKQQVEASKGKTESIDTITQIKRQSEKIKTKFRTAQKFVKAEAKAAKIAAAKEKEAADQEDPPGDEDEAAEQSKEAARQTAIAAEEGKLKQEEIKNGVDTTAGPSFVDESEKIDIAPSGNWVHPNRKPKAKAGKPKAKKAKGRLAAL
jgi:hypothetical protein